MASLNFDEEDPGMLLGHVALIHMITLLMVSNSRLVTKIICTRSVEACMIVIN